MSQCAGLDDEVVALGLHPESEVGARHLPRNDGYLPRYTEYTT